MDGFVACMWVGVESILISCYWLWMRGSQRSVCTHVSEGLIYSSNRCIRTWTCVSARFIVWSSGCCFPPVHFFCLLLVADVLHCDCRCLRKVSMALRIASFVIRDGWLDWCMLTLHNEKSKTRLQTRIEKGSIFRYTSFSTSLMNFQSC